MAESLDAQYPRLSIQEVERVGASDYSALPVGVKRTRWLTKDMVGFAKTAHADEPRHDVYGIASKFASDLNGGDIIRRSIDLFQNPNGSDSTGRDELQAALASRLGLLTSLLDQSGESFYLAADYGNQEHQRHALGRWFFLSDGILYSYLKPEVDPGDHYTIAAELAGFAIAGIDEPIPLHIEPLVKSKSSPDRIGLLPAGSIPLQYPLFTDISKEARLTTAS